MSKGALRQNRRGSKGSLKKKEKRRKTTMADFTTSNTTKSAVRKITDPLADVTAFDNLVQGVITNNPFQCVSYNAQGVNHPPVERSKQGYTARILYQDSDAKTVALITVRAPTIAAFTNVANQLVAYTPISTALGGTPARDADNEKFAATLKCHDANGEIYFVNFSRDQVTLTSFSDEAIRSRVETWADTVPALA
jgi:hypothetical protein